MATKRRGGLRPPELRGTLGTLLRTTTGVVRDVFERGAREGRARLDDARANRRRHDALAELGELVLDLIRRGEIDLAELPEARDLVRQLDDLDEAADANTHGARGSGSGLGSLVGRDHRHADSRFADGSRPDGRFDDDTDDDDQEPTRAGSRSRFDDRASHASDFVSRTSRADDDGTVSSISSADRSSRPTVGARPATARPASPTPSNRQSSPAIAAPASPSSHSGRSSSSATPSTSASARSSSSAPSTPSASRQSSPAIPVPASPSSQSSSAGRPSASTLPLTSSSSRQSSPAIPVPASTRSASAPPSTRSSSSPALPVPPPDEDLDPADAAPRSSSSSADSASTRAPTKPIKGQWRPLIEDAPTVPERPDAKRYPLPVDADRRGGISFDDDDLDDYMHPDDVPPRRSPGEPDDTSG